MGLSSLNDHRVTHAQVTVPAWGAWHAEVSIDGEFDLAGAVTLKLADVTFRGTVLSGGAAKGRSHFRIVGGAGGWGRVLKRKGYTNDAGVKLTTVLGDAAREAGETVDYGTRSSDRLGPAWAREDGQAREVLELVAPGAWYVGEDGTTRLGRRPATTYQGKATHGAVDKAARTVTLAAESIATLVPGVTVDGLEAVDVEHELTPEGLRTTIWGRHGVESDRRLAAYRRLFEAIDAQRKFRGVYEYRVGQRQGERLDLQPVRVSTGMPDLRRVQIRPGVAGIKTEIPLGARVLVAFVDASPSRPVVVGFEDPESADFQPGSMALLADGSAGGEHVMTTEAAALLVYNTFVCLMAAAGGGPLLAAVLQPLLGAAVVAALTAQGAPAPPTLVAQEALAASLLPTFATGTTPANTSAFFAAAIALAATKTSNVSGKFPSVGARAVEVG